MDQRPKCKMQNYKTPRRKYRGKSRRPRYADDFLHTTSKTRSIKEIIDKLDFAKIKKFCSVKDTVKRMRRKKHRLGENICKMYLIKDHYLKYTIILKTQQ